MKNDNTNEYPVQKGNSKSGIKINWGAGLVISMMLFMGFILSLVYIMSTDKKYHFDLVTEKYYQKEMELQDDIFAQQNNAAMKKQITGLKTELGYLLQFPEGFDPQKISGKAALYRPSDKRLDFEYPLEMTDLNVLIPGRRLVEGRWNITVDWEYDGKKYRFKKEITY